MDLDSLSINLRPRSAWEGVDLGFAMAREWFLPLWLLWLSSALPVMLVLTLLPLPLWLAGLLLWWFKPVYEPPLLYWLSRRLFAERPSVSEVFRGWTKIVLPQLIAGLTWRRLTPSRSFVMPVAVLEGLKGRSRRSRIGILGRGMHAAGWLTLVGLHFEIVLELGLIVLVAALIPEELLWIDWQGYLFDPDPLSEWLHHACALAAMSLIAPFYVAGGFALYLTRRSQLEAWDLELGLRRMAQRHLHRRLAGAVSILLVCLAVLVMPARDAQAIEVSRQHAQELIQEVLAEEAFGRYETHTDWRYIADEEADQASWMAEWLRLLLSGFSNNLAGVGEVLLWLAIAGVLAYLLHWFVQNRSLLYSSGNTSGGGDKAPPSHIAGLDLRPESLPDDPGAAASRLIEAGEYRSGLSLLYRAALSVLIHRYALEIKDGATEGECLAHTRNTLAESQGDYFARLTRAWLALAYGHRQPQQASALALCQEWASHFGAANAQ
ncbi:MAG: DUF4129 domain-containing protein [Candidatus Thiodiazotropha sp. (ex Dulcina madagascariensis)]|nr:DUF4129 domain-containing protein [Candidatus Thiodiazotropha sp. (ex Dulcina madagascariensis)]